MSARAKLIDDEPRERRAREPIRSAMKTAPGGRDAHVHCVIFFGETGRGYTSEGPDGHTHRVRDLDLAPAADGHTHELSATRCNARHHWDTGRHVRPRR